MKKLIALVLTLTMLSAMILVAPLNVAAETAVGAVSAINGNYIVNSDTFKLNNFGGSGLSVNGSTVSLNYPTVNTSAPSTWPAADLKVNDDLKDGFTVKISDIVWDEDSNHAVTVVYGNTANLACNKITDTLSNFTLLVKKDGSIVLWGNGYSSNHTYGKWAPISVTNKTLGKQVNEFTYKLVPNADGTYSFWVDEVLIVTHRPGALQICNRIFEVTEGKIT